MTSADRSALVRDARRRIARGSRSFRFASRLFDRETRHRVWLLYSWCRACDDIVDGQTLGHDSRAVAEPEAAIRMLYERTDAALRGGITGDAPFDGLGLLAAECGLPRQFIHEHLHGFALDSRNWRPATLTDLLTYCYHVAGVVGCMMAILMGIDPADEDVLDRAADLGIAFQLSNIARDVREDHAVGRCYLPVDWLKGHGIAPGDEMEERHREGLVAIIYGLAQLAARYEQSARIGAQFLPPRSRWAVLAAAGIYGGIGREVARRGAKAWDKRVSIGKWEKLVCVIAAWRDAKRTSTSSPRRWGLWTRPR